ncbi:reverse transcriptase RNA-dependent DNA polymerase [Nitzschia inconspicua]|uniref:Reverse transcriptase RNA-dependent DNA polymerase n=1 Tax=Nitzschia inconspicua TaxID=303405 RepID=A0A9K3KSN6_9STRA|nr:reverse transcriptase RNA-dependent DNA polymerase [Nitzschia inconspicua]
MEREHVGSLTYLDEVDGTQQRVLVPRGTRRLITILQDFLRYKVAMGEPIENDWTGITQEQFDEFRIGDAYLHANAMANGGAPDFKPVVNSSTSTPLVQTPSATTSAQPSAVEMFKKGIKRDQEVLRPIKTSMDAVLEPKVQTSKGKEAIQEHEATKDAPAAYANLMEHHRKSTAADIEVRKTNTVAATISDGKLKGTTSEFLTNWTNGLKPYENLVGSSYAFEEDEKVMHPSQAITTVSALRQVKLMADMLQVLTKHPIDFQQYSRLLSAAAVQYDDSLTHEDDPWDPGGSFDLDSPVSHLEAKTRMSTLQRQRSQSMENPYHGRKLYQRNLCEDMEEFQDSSVDSPVETVQCNDELQDHNALHWQPSRFPPRNIRAILSSEGKRAPVRQVSTCLTSRPVIHRVSSEQLEWFKNSVCDRSIHVGEMQRIKRANGYIIPIRKSHDLPYVSTDKEFDTLPHIVLTSDNTAIINFDHEEEDDQWIDAVEGIRATFQHVTQLARSSTDTPLQTVLRSQNPALNAIRSSATPAVDCGATPCQVLVWMNTNVNPIQTSTQLVKSLENNVRCWGAPTKFVSDSTPIDISGRANRNLMSQLMGRQHSIHLPRQVNLFQHFVCDRPVHVGWMQRNKTTDGCIIPIATADGPSSVNRRPSTGREFNTLSHVIMTSYNTWNPGDGELSDAINLQLGTIAGEARSPDPVRPTIFSNFFDLSHFSDDRTDNLTDDRSNYVDSRSEDNETEGNLIINENGDTTVLLDNLVGTYYLMNLDVGMNKNHDGNLEADSKKNVFLCTMMDLFNRDGENPVLWKCKKITSHQRPLRQEDRDYRGSAKDVLQEQETGEISGIDDPLIYAICVMKKKEPRVWEFLALHVEDLSTTRPQIQKPINQLTSLKLSECKLKGTGEIFNHLIMQYSQIEDRTLYSEHKKLPKIIGGYVLLFVSKSRMNCHAPAKKGDHPETDMSRFMDEDSLIGALQWFSGYFERIQRNYSYLHRMSEPKIWSRNEEPNYFGLFIYIFGWPKPAYGFVSELHSDNAPEFFDPLHHSREAVTAGIKCVTRIPIKINPGNMLSKVFLIHGTHIRPLMRSFQVVMSLAELNGLELWSKEIGNTHLESYLDRENRALIIWRAFYGLNLSGQEWHDKLHDCLVALASFPCRVEPDIWMRKNGELQVSEYIVLYIGDLSSAMQRPRVLIGGLTPKFFEFELKCIWKVFHHLRMQFRQDKDHALRLEQKRYLMKMIDGFFKPRPKEDASLERGSHPKMNTSPTLDEEKSKFYQSLIGALQWIFTIGWFNIFPTLIIMSFIQDAPKYRHLEKIMRIHSCLSFVRGNTAGTDQNRNTCT